MRNIKSVNRKIKQSANESINEIFGETKTVVSLKLPANLLTILLINRKNPRFSQGLCNCNNKNCKLCTLYIKSCASFNASYNFIWCIRSDTPCESKNAIYILKYTGYNYRTTHIGKAIHLGSHIHNHITSSRLGDFTGKIDNCVYFCMQNQKQEQFFKY